MHSEHAKRRLVGGYRVGRAARMRAQSPEIAHHSPATALASAMSAG